MPSIEIISGLVLMASLNGVSAAHEQQHQALVTARDHCRDDVHTLCAALPPNTLLTCLKLHASQVSRACHSAIGDANVPHAAESAN
jgi:hypothetical protein